MKEKANKIRVLQVNKLYYPWIGGIEKVFQVAEGLRWKKINILAFKSNRYELNEASKKKGLERVKMFSWDKAAEEHIKLFEEIMGEGGNER